MPIRFSGLELLTPEQQELLKEYAFWQNALVSSPEDFDYQEALQVVEDQLIRMGLYPCYDDEDECYTYIVG